MPTPRFVALLLVGLSLAAPSAAQTTDETFPISVARMYGVPTSRAWADLQQVLKDAGFKTELKDDDGQFLITQQERVEAKRFGFSMTDVFSNLPRGMVKLHVFVPRYVEPARVYIGSTVTAELQDRSGSMLVYSPDAFGDWLFRKLSAKLAVPAHRIPQEPQRRAALARSLSGNPDDKCLTQLVNGRYPTGATAIVAKKLHDIPAVYPRSGTVNEIGRALVVKIVIGEDGFAWPIGVADGAPADDFSITSLGSLPLWRFAPATIDGCPAPTRSATVSITFKLR